jgi:hypothetical protein
MQTTLLLLPFLRILVQDITKPPDGSETLLYYVYVRLKQWQLRLEFTRKDNVLF